MARQSENVPVRRQSGMPSPAWSSPLGLWGGLSAEMDRMFNSMLRGSFPRAGASEGQGFESLPAMDVIDKEKEIVVRAELPGMEQKDIDVQLSDGTLRIRGEKREEREEGQREGDYYLSELRYGSFQRSLALPPNIDRDAVSATFRNGTLTIKLPRTKESQSSTKKIDVRQDS